MTIIHETLAIAIRHHQTGQLQAAEQDYRRILRADPNHADAIHLLGVIAHQVGRHEVAVQCIERAIRLNGNQAAFHNNLAEAYRALRRIPEAIACYHRALALKPAYAEAHNNLGNVLREQGRVDEAVACCRRASELRPDYAEMHNNLGNALKDRGDLDEAVQCYHRALELKPNYPEAHNNLGVALMEQGKMDQAVASCRRALELKPNYPEAHNNLGNALTDQGKAAEAVACYRRALALKPAYVEAYHNLGNALRELGKVGEAVACYRQALALKPDFAEANNNLGNALRELGKVDEAVACCRQALALKPNDAEVHGNLGSALEEIGDLQGAEESFRAALEHDPRCALAHFKLAELLGGNLPENDLAAQRRLLEQGSASGEQRELADSQRFLLHFGLAQVLGARGEYDEAAKHLNRGNALQMSDWRDRGRAYDPKEHELRVNQMIRVCTPDFFARVRDFGSDSELPVFVVGLPRSGTTLVEQILAGHTRVFGAGEIKLVHETMDMLGRQGTDSIEGLSRLNHQTTHDLALRHVERLRTLDRTALRIVDKLPSNYFFLGLLASLVPRAKFIHCRRDLRDVALSCWITLFREIRWANDHQQIASRFRDHERMMEHWREVLPVPLLEVDYEETVTDLEGVARKLVAWCGLEWEPGCLEFHRGKRVVRTASAVQVRQPVFRTSVGRWKLYEQALAPLFAQLKSMVAAD